jgi:NTE family protein
MHDEVEDFLAKTLLFSPLPAQARADVAAAVQVVELDKGEVLFEPGAAGDTAFVVRSGLVQVVEAIAGGRVLAEAARGEHLGEMAALTGEPRAAGAVAAVDSVLYAIPGALLRGLFQQHPGLHARLSLALMRNLQRRMRECPAGVQTCALVGSGTAAGASLALALAVAAETAAGGTERIAVLDCGASGDAGVSAPSVASATLTAGVLEAEGTLAAAPPAASDRVAHLRLDPGAADAAVAGVVAELRRRHDRLLVHAALPWSNATARAVAQCDAIYWVLDADDGAAEASRAQAEHELATLTRRGIPARRIRLTRDEPARGRAPDPGAPPTRTVPGVAAGSATPFDGVGARRALRALAREIGGRQRALVLGAGGAKGFAHIGALRAFERHGIEFDAVAGASIGAIIGAFTAMGHAAATIEAVLLGIAARPWRTLLDLRLPTEAFFRSRKKRELIESHCGGIRIEELALPFFAVAGDLSSLCHVVFSTGPLAVALDASSAIPTIFRPVRLDGQMLVDGWVCDPLPADVVRAAGYPRVTAVDLSPRPGAASPRMQATPGLGARFRILAIAMRAMELASREHVERTVPLVDVLIRPALEGYSSMDFEAARAICERGERAAEDALAAIGGGAAAV